MRDNFLIDLILEEAGGAASGCFAQAGHCSPVGVEVIGEAVR